MIRLLAAAAVLTAVLAPAANAHSPISAEASAVIGGKRWPGHPTARITYFNASEAKWAVRQAAKAWNSSGAHLEFVAAPRGRADVLVKDIKSPRSDTSLFGFGTLGYIPPGGKTIYFDRNGRVRLSSRATVTLSLMRHPKRPNYNMAGVATHEFGHILGLNHEDDVCATMNSTLWSQCGRSRPCRLLERDDIKGALRQYGGRVRMNTPDFCPKAPRKVRSVGDPREYGVTLEWRNPRGGLFKRTVVERAKGKCPKSAGAFGGIPLSGNRPGKKVRLKDHDFAKGSTLRTGRYCYALWGVGDNGVMSRRRKVWVDFDPPRPSGPTQFTAVGGPDGSIALSWGVAPHPELDRVAGVGKLGQCPTDIDDGEEFFESQTGSATVYPQTAGHYCFAAWSLDSIGGTHGRVTVEIDFAGAPPTADFDYFTDSLTAYFTNYSYDEDGAIVAYHWDFGDGHTSSESDPAHAYGVAGTYTVRLTVTDDTGQTGTATQQVTVG